MQRYFVRRILQSVLVLWLLSIGFFVLVHLLPPSARAAEMGPRYGGDLPLPIQYLAWLGGVLHGNFGYSLIYTRPVTAELSERLPATLELMLPAMAFALAVSLVIGISSAVKQYSLTDHLATVLAYAGVATPLFWLGLICQEIFAVRLHLLPDLGRGSIDSGAMPFALGFGDALWHLVLPAFVLSVPYIAIWTRYLRTSMLTVIKQDYLQTARAKGLTQRDVYYVHALGNALIPLVTVIALSFGSILSTTAVVETVFAWPGMGLLFINALSQGDYPTLVACLVISGTAVIGFNLLADLLYAVIDPRIHYS